MAESVLLYALSYIVSLGLFWIYCRFIHLEKIENKWKRRFYKFLWFSLIISPVVLLASLRYQTATDYDIYRRYYQYNEMHGIKYFVRGGGNLSEFLFWGSLELGRVLFGDLHGFFFIASFLTLFAVIASLDKYRDKMNVVWSYFVFLMVLFPTSLNIVRQMIAVGIVIFGLHYIEDNRRLRFLVCTLIATLFHTSAIVCLGFLLFFKHKNKSFEKIRNRLIWVGIILLPILMPVLLFIAGELPIFNKYFSTYEIVFEPRWGLLLKKIPLILLVAIYFKKLLRADKRNMAYLQMFFAQLSVYFVSFYTKWGFRMAYYLDFATMILIPKIIMVEKDKKRRWLLIGAIVVYYVGFYVYSFIIQNQDGIYPYRSILGWP